MDTNSLNYTICQMELEHLDSIEEVAGLSKDGIKPNKRMIYFLGCTVLQHYGLVLKEGEKVVGFILSIPNKEGELLWIHQIAINPNCRGKGYGSTLMKATFDLAVQNKVESLQLAVNPKNKAFDWYTKLGFQGQEKSKEIGMIIMNKKLF